MMAFWNSLQVREQRAMLIAALALLVALVFLGLVEPLMERREQARDRLAESRVELAWMEAHASEVAAARDREPEQDDRPNLEGRSLIAHVDASARAFGLNGPMVRSRPGESGVNVSLEGAPYREVMRWLDELEQKDDVLAERIVLERTPAPGRIDAELLLSRKP